MPKQTSENRAIIFSLVGSGGLFILQLVAYFMSHIILLLAGAFDTLSDILISGFLLLSIYWSKKPADEFHMFGHGRAQNIASLLVSTILIFFLSLETFRSAIPKFFQPTTNELQNITLALIVTVIAIIIYAVPLIDILRSKKNGAAIKTQWYALLEMEFAFFASLIGLLLINRGFQWVDPLISVLIGIVIAWVGIKLLIDNANFLLGRGPGAAYIKKIEKEASSVKGVVGVTDIKAEYIGPESIHAGLNLVIKSGTPIEQADQIAKEVKKRIHGMEETSSCFIQIKPEVIK
jgi:cation diffusion facilitator family transporter